MVVIHNIDLVLRRVRLSTSALTPFVKAFGIQATAEIGSLWATVAIRYARSLNGRQLMSSQLISLFGGNGSMLRVVYALFTRSLRAGRNSKSASSLRILHLASRTPVI